MVSFTFFSLKMIDYCEESGVNVYVLSVAVWNFHNLVTWTTFEQVGLEGNVMDGDTFTANKFSPPGY